MRFLCAARTHVGLKRKINEDSILAATERGLWVVADGMGGHDAGEIASRMVTRALRSLPPATRLDSLAACALETVRKVNGELIALAGPGRTIGTTLVGLAIANNAFCCFWLGDSRAYRFRGGELERLSHDHSLVQELVDAGMIGAEEAESHESANLITRAVGVAETIDLDTSCGEVCAGDLFLLATDGLTRLVPDAELAVELARAQPDEAADALIDTVLARGAPDNVSLIIVRTV